MYFHELNLDLGFTENQFLEIKNEVLQFIEDFPESVLNYKAWIDAKFGVNSSASDWVSIIIDGRSVHPFFSPLFNSLREKFKIFNPSETDYVQFHVSNIKKNPTGVFVPPHRDVRRAAGINFGIYNYEASELCAYEDRRVLAGEIPRSRSLMPRMEFLDLAATLIYQQNRAYLLNAEELHNIRYLPGFRNDVRIIGAYALRPDDGTNFSQIRENILKGSA